MWYNKDIQAVLKELGVDLNSGLSDTEVESRKEKYGLNKLKVKKRKSIFKMLFQQLNDWLIYVLVAAVVITMLMGEYIDAIIIIAVIIINATLGVIQELKAGKAIEALQKMSAPKTLVKRGGQVVEIDAEFVVPGDVIVLDAGRYISADLRLVESANLQIEESALTGESVAAEKDAQAIIQDSETPLGDRVNMGFMSTIVTYGRGVGIAVGTGMDTEIGKIAGILDNEEEGKTPLELRLDKLGKTLGLIAISICVLIFVLSWIQGRDLAEMFLISVSLAVASIPEGLAAIVAVVLSIGVKGMSKRNAIIKRLPAVETLGSVNIICSDKTGTLTQNKMSVVKYYTIDGEVELNESNQEAINKTVELLVKAMVNASDATLKNGEGTGNPTEIALLAMADKLNIDRKIYDTEIRRKNEYPFDSERKLMSTLVEEKGRETVFTKGAIGSLLGVCSLILDNGKAIPLDENGKDKIKSAARKMSQDALRTLGVAYKNVAGDIEKSEMEQELIFIGLVGMMDPPRIEVKPSIEKAKQAGIKTIMITGDHKNTAFAIAEQLGIAEKIEQAISGKELDQLSESAFASTIKDKSVFARVSPEHKVQIVRALKENGNIVSMTGDGVNDAPSLNAADIGVAMGITGTDVAKGAADMILTDDNFSTIISAIEQGRNIYNNIKKAVIFLLTCNLGEVITMFICLLIGWDSPLIATQLLWVNLVTDTLPAIALGMDKRDPDVMKEKPRAPQESFFAHGAGHQTIVGGILIGVLTIFGFWYGYYEHDFSPFDKNIPKEVVEYARTMALMILVCTQLFYALAIRSHFKSIFTIGIFSNRILIAAIFLGVLLQVLIIEIPFMRSAFKLQMLDLNGWIMAISLGLIPLFFSEIQKIFMRMKMVKT